MAMMFNKKATVAPLEVVDPKLLGWFVWWNMPRNAVGYPVSQVRSLMEKYGLPQIAEGIKNRSAIIRALRLASKGKRKSLDIVVDDDTKIQFQISHITLEDDVKYGKIAKFLADAVITYNKNSQDIKCDNPKIKSFVTDKFLAAKENYKTTDISRLLMRLLEKHADIVSLRDQGGAYMVPAKYKTYLEAVGKVMKDLGNSLEFHAMIDAEGNREKMISSARTEQESAIDDFKSAIDDLRAADAEKDADEDKLFSESRTKRKNAFRRVKRMMRRARMWEESLKYKANDLKVMIKEAEDYAVKFFGAAEEQ